MTVISVTNVDVKNNPAKLTDPFQFEVSFECFKALKEDLEWRLVYVGDPENKLKDQELDCVALGPIQRGALRFTFVTNPPDFTQIKKEDIDGITIILLTGTYRNQEFIRVGWYIHNYFTHAQDIENPPDIDELCFSDIFARMRRLIIADAPRVTRFKIEWDDELNSIQNNSFIFPALVTNSQEISKAPNFSNDNDNDVDMKTYSMNSMTRNSSLF